MKKKKNKSTILLVIILLVGLSIMLYPTVSDYYNSFHSSRVISSYTEQVSVLENAVYERIWNEAVEYNSTLPEKAEPFLMTSQDKELYYSLLDPSGLGVMGYIEIPKIKCNLPIYHGTEEKVLQVAVGHIEGTSLPVGGESTHCALSGHRGLPSAKLFTDLDQMEIGDVFMLKILDETLTYEVDQIRIVLPNEMDELKIREGEDLCTLTTCTPYGINSHRMLVRGHRIENAAATIRVTADALRIDPLLVAPAAAVPMLLILAVWLFFGGSGGKKPAKREKRPKRARPGATEKGGDSHEN